MSVVALQIFPDTPQLLFLIIAAFAGGAFGAAIGALPAFCFTGFMVIAGEAANTVGIDAGASGAALLGSPVTGQIGFGAVFGPHIAFAGGAAAAAYAAKTEGAMYEPGDGDYHTAKDIAYALGTRPDVLVVGGLFGIIGAIGTTISAGLTLPWDDIAIMVVVSAALHRVAFGYPLIGKPGGDGLLDMSPFERGEMRGAATDGGTVMTDGGYGAERLSVEPWLPHQYTWGNVAMIGLVAGLLGGFTALATGSAFLAFGISAASLTFLNLGVEKIPVTHHMTLPASTAALAVFADPSGMSQVIALLVGGVFGIYGALIGEVVQRIFYAHSDTHFDPPAAAIVVATLTIAILAIVGVFDSAAWVQTLGL
ncbi:MAG: hypothetical protein RI531_03170 [Haloferacaceae archaeon]|jgi:hypothetical protein|nr:hypothetical protein [Haloferacaceae archaeon]